MFMVTKKWVFALLFLMSLIGQVSARDIVDEQYQVRMAQKEYDNARSGYEATNQQIQQYEQRINQLNAQLEPVKKSLPAKQERFNKAKASLEEKTKILDKAWEENKKN